MLPDPATTPLDRDIHRPISVVELFTISIGPSSSHTVGPMRAAYDFAQRTLALDSLPVRITCDLYPSIVNSEPAH